MVLRIRELRKERGLTQGELGAMLGVGKGIVCNWESETFLPKTRDLPNLADALGVGIGELFATDRNVARKSILAGGDGCANEAGVQ